MIQYQIRIMSDVPEQFVRIASHPEVTQIFNRLFAKEWSSESMRFRVERETLQQDARDEFMTEFWPFVKAYLDNEKKMSREACKQAKQKADLQAKEKTDREASPLPARKNGKGRRVLEDSDTSDALKAKEKTDREASPLPARKNGKGRRVLEDSDTSDGETLPAKAPKVSGGMSVAQAMAAARDDDVVDLTVSDAE